MMAGDLPLMHPRMKDPGVASRRHSNITSRLKKLSLPFWPILLWLFCCFITNNTRAEVQIQRISDRVVPVPGGNVKGVIAVITDDHPKLKGKSIEQFYGIQYASAPERFLPPERPTDQWPGNRIVWNPAPACPGPEFPNGVDEDLRRVFGYNHVARARIEAAVNAGKVFDADAYDTESTCLKMNIYVPYDNSSSRQPSRAVLVFIPAESYDIGSANAYNPSVLAAYGNIIVVTLNYRLGAFGFMTSAGDPASTSAASGAPGNIALFDVVSALHFVRGNIANFGGDPHRITLMGHQHGGALVHLLMASPVVRGNRLFQRAILMSGSALAPWAVQSSTAAYAAMQSMGMLAGCAEPFLRQSKMLLKCLRNKNVQQLANIHVKPALSLGPSLGDDTTFQPLAPNAFSPTITSGNLLSINMDEMHQRRLPYDVMLGVSTASGAELTPDECLTNRCNSSDQMRIIRSFVRLVFGAESKSAKRIFEVLAHQYKDHRRPGEDADAIAVELASLLGDGLIVAPIVKTANIQSKGFKTGATVGAGLHAVYFYAVDKPSPVYIPGDELSYIFGAPLVSSLPPWASGRKFSAEERAVSQTMMNYWSNFVKNGNPNSPNSGREGQRPAWRSVQEQPSPVWPAYTAEMRDYLRIGSTGIVPDQRYRADMVALWLDLIPRLLAADSNGNGGSGQAAPFEEDFSLASFPPPPPMPPPPFIFFPEPIDITTFQPVTVPISTARISAVPFKDEPLLASSTLPTSKESSTRNGRTFKLATGLVVINGDLGDEAGFAESVPTITAPTATIELAPNEGQSPVLSDSVLATQPPTTTEEPEVSKDTHQGTFLGGIPLSVIVITAVIGILVIANIIVCVIMCRWRKKRKERKLKQLQIQQSFQQQQQQQQQKMGSVQKRPGVKANGKASNGSLRSSNGHSFEMEPLKPTLRHDFSKDSSPRASLLPAFKAKAKASKQRGGSRPTTNGHIYRQEQQGMGKSGRVSISLEDVAASFEIAPPPGNGVLPTNRTGQPYLSRKPTAVPSSNSVAMTREPSKLMSRSSGLIARRNSLPRPLVSLTSIDGQFRSSPERGEFGHPIVHCDRELPPTSAIRLVNHARVSSGSGVEGSGGTIGSPLPEGSTTGTMKSIKSANGRLSDGMILSPLLPPPLPPPPLPPPLPLMQQPGASHSLGRRSSSPSPRRALPPPPPPPKPKMLGNGRQSLQISTATSLKSVKFSSQHVEIPASVSPRSEGVLSTSLSPRPLPDLPIEDSLESSIMIMTTTTRKANGRPPGNGTNLNRCKSPQRAMSPTSVMVIQPPTGSWSQTTTISSGGRPLPPTPQHKPQQNGRAGRSHSGSLSTSSSCSSATSASCSQ